MGDVEIICAENNLLISKVQNNLIGLYWEGGLSELLYMGPLKNSPVCNGPCGGIVNWRLTAQLGGAKRKALFTRAGGMGTLKYFIISVSV